MLCSYIPRNISKCQAVTNLDIVLFRFSMKVKEGSVSCVKHIKISKIALEFIRWHLLFRVSADFNSSSPETFWRILYALF